MNAGGKTQVVKLTDIDVGRMILCNEKPATPATSACAKKLAETITAAKKGLIPAQEKLWQRMVYVSAVLNAERFGKEHVRGCAPWDMSCRLRRKGNLSAAESFKLNVMDILSGTLKFEDIFKKEHTWSDYLLKGGELIKKLQNDSKDEPRGIRDDYQ